MKYAGRSRIQSIRIIFERMLCIVLLLLLCTVLVRHDKASAQQTGTLQGKITDGETGERIIGANIIIAGTVLGGIANTDGEFIIRKIPTGIYAIVIAHIGYERKEITAISIAANETTHIEIALTASSLHTGDVVVTANRRAQSLAEIPVSVSVIDAAQIIQRNPVTPDQSLRYVSGINVSEGQINIRGFSGYTKGVGSRVLLLVDGMPMLSGDSQEIIWETLPVSTISKIEIVKGAGSATYGSSALGGVVNILTKEIPELPSTQIKLYGGMYEQPRYKQWQWSSRERVSNGISLFHSQKINDVGLLYGVVRTQDDGYKRNDYFTRWNLFSKMHFIISSYENLTVNTSLLLQQRGNFFYWKNLERALEPADDQLRERVVTIRASTSFAYRHIVSPELFYNFRGAGFFAQWKNIAAVQSGDSTQTHSRSFASSWELQFTYQPKISSTYTFGGEAKSNIVSANLFGERMSNGGGIYVQEEEIFSENVRTTAGVRADFSKADSLRTAGEINPKFGIVVTPQLGTTLRASAGRGFRAPSIAELFIETCSGPFCTVPNKTLRAEQSWSMEVGVKQFFSKSLFADVSLFQSEFDDMIEPQFIRSNGGGLDIQFQNVLHARVQGVESSINAGLFEDALQITLSFTHVRTKDITNNTPLKYRPKNLFYISLNGKEGNIFYGADYRSLSRVEKIDEQFTGIIPQGNFRVPIYVLDARVGADIPFPNGAITITLMGNNILQYYYNEFIGTIAPIRNFVLAVEVKL